MKLTIDNIANHRRVLEHLEWWAANAPEDENDGYRLESYGAGAVIEPSIRYYNADDTETTADERRVEALAFLARWMRRFTPLGKVEKHYGHYDVSCRVVTEDGLSFKAEVSAEMTCTYVPVLDEQGEPVMVDKEESEVTYTPVIKKVPAMERVCPPSFLAGLDQ